MIRSSIIFLLLFVIPVIVGVQNKSYAQDGNEELNYSISRPGLIAPNSSGSQVISEEVLSQEVLLDFVTFPFAQLNDTPDQPAELTEVACLRRIYVTCLLRINLDGSPKIFVAEKNNTSWTINLAPTGAFEKFTFANNFLSITNSSHLTFAFNNENERRIFSWSLSKDQVSKSIPIKDEDFAIVRNVYDSENIKAMVLLAPNTPFVAATSATKWLILYKDGTSQELQAASECNPVAVLRDTIICAYWGDKIFSEESSETKIWRDNHAGLKLTYIAPTQGNDIFIEVNGKRDSFHYVDEKLAFTLIQDGWQRPYIFDLNTPTASPLLDENCNAGQQHISALAATSKGDAVILNYYSPLHARHYKIATSESQFDKNCLSDGRTVSKEKDDLIFDRTKINMKRLKTDKRNVPILLLHSKTNGKAKGQLMLQSYGAYGIWNDERYNPAWASQWMAEGGSIAFIHVRGGGGFGPSWWRSGIGIAGKQEAAKDLVDAAFYLQNKDSRFVGNTSIYAQSAGGILASSVALRGPRLIQNVILRAPCMSFTAGLRYECSGDNDFGNPLDAEEALQMTSISPRDIASTITEFPNFVFLVPEFDDLVDPENILYGSATIPDEYKRFINLPGVYHTDLLPKEQEEALINSIVENIVNKNDVLNKNEGNKPQNDISIDQ